MNALPVPRLHLVEKTGNFRQLSPYVFQSSWCPDPSQDAWRLIHGHIYFHRERSLPSFDGGRIVSCKEGTSQNQGHVAFIFIRQDECKNVVATSGQWASYEMDVVREPKKQGRCFPNAFRYMTYLYERSLDSSRKEDERAAYGTVRLVHGQITPRKGENADQVTDHAWVELGDMVYETADGDVVRLTKAEYESSCRPKRIACFSAEEASDLAARENTTYGPWF